MPHASGADPSPLSHCDNGKSVCVFEALLIAI